MDQVKYIAIRNHIPEATDELLVSIGDALKYERRNTSYLGWIWCTDSNGTQAWVPEAFVTIEGDRCHMLRDYSSRELAVVSGDTVEVLEIESGWAWACDTQGEAGWILMECLQRSVPEDASSR